MTTPEATVHLTAERSQQWHHSFHALLADTVRLEEMQEPRGLGLYLEGYNPTLDTFMTGLSERELREFHQYLGAIGPYRNNHWSDNLSERHRHRHPSFVEMRRPIRYLRREVSVGPIEDFNPDVELPEDLHMRAAEHRFSGELRAHTLGETIMLSEQALAYQISVYRPIAARGPRRRTAPLLSFALTFRPTLQQLSLSRVALHHPNFTDHSRGNLEPTFDELLGLFHVEKANGDLRTHRGQPIIRRQAS